MYEFDAEFLAKIETMREAGEVPYPNGMAPTHTSTQLHERWHGVEAPDGDDTLDVAVAGRVMFRNRMGKAIFLRLLDRGTPVVTGTDDEGADVVRDGIIQVYARRDEIGDDAFAKLKALDIGDFVWAKGTVIRTRTGELSVQATEARPAGKIMMPFPDRWHGLQDVETRSRMRYVDLFMNGDTRAVFRARSAVVRTIRRFLEDRDFLEVETPILHPIPGGAAARPFVTHHNALDMPLYLRIAPELYLKRLLVGGLERVYEINRSFRNEGVSVKHNPEFTMLEFYWAWATVDDLMDLTEAMVSACVDEVHGPGTTELTFGPHTIDVSGPWRRADMDELVAEKTGLSRAELRDPAACEAWWRANRTVADDAQLPTTWGKWWELLFEELVEHTLVNPTFVTGFPAEISPLSRRNDDDPEIVDRFELIIATWEMANAFSELNDPVDQAERFAAQVAQRDAGDAEAMFFDADYVRALSYGMPPAAGEGIGIDRLVMLLTGRTSIREVILFPTLRPEAPLETSSASDADTADEGR